MSTVPAGPDGLHGALQCLRSSSQRPLAHVLESAHAALGPPVAVPGGVKQTKHGVLPHVDGPPQRALALVAVHDASSLHEVGEWHVPPTHVSKPRHPPPAQHGCPSPPQLLHVPLEVQSALPLHVPPTPPQHGSPGPPHSQMSVVELHEAPALQPPPAQHGSPTPPHFAHVPVAAQTKPVPHVEPSQHTSPRPPHFTHEPPLPHV